MEGDGRHNLPHKQGDGEGDAGEADVMADDGDGDDGNYGDDDGDGEHEPDLSHHGRGGRGQGPGRRSSWTRAYFTASSATDRRCLCLTCNGGPFGSATRDAQPITLLRHLQDCGQVRP